jgi:hypothetical protein
MRESEGGMNREKKIIIEKLILQKNPDTTTKCTDYPVKFLDLLVWHPVLILVLGILGFVGKGAVPLVRQLGKRWLFFSIPWSYDLSITSRSSELVSPDD